MCGLGERAPCPGGWWVQGTASLAEAWASHPGLGPQGQNVVARSTGLGAAAHLAQLLANLRPERAGTSLGLVPQL